MNPNFIPRKARRAAGTASANRRTFNPWTRLVDPLRSKAFLKGVRDWRWLNVSRHLESAMGRLAALILTAAVFLGSALPVRACGPSVPGPLGLFLGIFNSAPAAAAPALDCVKRSAPEPGISGGCCPFLSEWRRGEGARLVVKSLAALPV